MVVTNDDEFRVFTADIRTGKILADLPVLDAKWGMRLNDSGPISAEIDCFTEEALAINLRNVTAQWRCALAVSYGGFVMEAGPIIDRGFDALTGKMTLTGAGIWAVLERRRMLMAHMLEAPPSAIISSGWEMGPTSLRSIAREIVRVSMLSGPTAPDGAPAGHLPIILPDIVTGNDIRKYHGHQMISMGEELKKFSQLSGGPDIRFIPRFKPGEPTYIEWVMDTGTPDAPLLKGRGDPWKWDGTRPESGVTDLSTDEDGSKMASRVYMTGQGQEVATPLAVATNLDLVEAGGPWLDQNASAAQEEEQTVLQSLANREVAEARAPMNTVTLSVRADYWPYLGKYMPGDMARVVVPEDHPTLDPGPIDVRIMAIDGGIGSEVSLTLSPVRGSLKGSPRAQGMTFSVEVPDIYPSDSIYPSYQLFPSE